MERKNAWKSYDENNKKELEILCKEYREFLSAGKTERECVKPVSYTHLSRFCPDRTSGKKPYKYGITSAVTYPKH